MCSSKTLKGQYEIGLTVIQNNYYKNQSAADEMLEDNSGVRQNQELSPWPQWPSILHNKYTVHTE